MERDRIEAALRAIYAARAANDAEGILDAFAPGGCYRIAGSQETCTLATAHRGEALRPAVETMCRMFHVRELRPGRMVIDGEQAAVVVDARFTFMPTGEEVQTAMVNFWTFRDGKVVDVIEFLDTAHVERLLAASRPG